MAVLRSCALGIQRLGRTPQRIHEPRRETHAVFKELVSMGSACNDLVSALEHMLAIPGNPGASFHELAERIDLVLTSLTSETNKEEIS
jgi:hypothetical protein